MKRAQAVTQRVGTGEIGERARIHIGWAKILPSLQGEDDDNIDNDGNGENGDNGENDGDDNGEEPGVENKSGSKLPGVGVSIRIIKPITKSDKVSLINTIIIKNHEPSPTDLNTNK